MTARLREHTRLAVIAAEQRSDTIAMERDCAHLEVAELRDALDVRLYADNISDAVGDEFGWCEFSGNSCHRHMDVRYSETATRCNEASDAHRAARDAVESVLADIRGRA